MNNVINEEKDAILIDPDDETRRWQIKIAKDGLIVSLKEIVVVKKEDIDA